MRGSHALKSVGKGKIKDYFPDRNVKPCTLKPSCATTTVPSVTEASSEEDPAKIDAIKEILDRLDAIEKRQEVFQANFDKILLEKNRTLEQI